MKTIKLIHVAGPFGDETSKYNIVFPNMTIADFILTVLKENPDEWGTIRFNGEIICEYKKGNTWDNDPKFKDHPSTHLQAMLWNAICLCWFELQKLNEDKSSNN